jgi:CrcB protein
MMKIFLVFLGGGIGAVARYGLQGLVHRYAGSTFPYGTLAVNVLGCFVIGFLMVAFEERFLIHPTLRIFLTIGILGGFTTFSSFSYETIALLRDGEVLFGGINIIAGVVVCLSATFVGMIIGKVI